MVTSPWHLTTDTLANVLSDFLHSLVFQTMGVSLETCDHNEKFQKVSSALPGDLTWLSKGTLRRLAPDSKLFDAWAEEGKEMWKKERNSSWDPDQFFVSGVKFYMEKILDLEDFGNYLQMGKLSMNMFSGPPARWKKS